MGIENLDPDMAEVQALIARSDAFYTDLYPPESNHLEDFRSLKAANVIFIGYRAETGLVACGAAKVLDDDGTYAEIKRVFVDAQYRGQGLSVNIMRCLENELVNRGIGIFRLETGFKQPQAISLYRKLGYSERGPYGRYTQDPMSVFMEKQTPQASC